MFDFCIVFCYLFVFLINLVRFMIFFLTCKVNVGWSCIHRCWCAHSAATAGRHSFRQIDKEVKLQLEMQVSPSVDKI